MSPQLTLHPSKLTPAEWVIFSQSLQSGGFVIEHQIQPSGECDISGGFTHHVLILELGNVSRQIFCIDGRSHDDSLHRGDLLLIPAGVPFSGACETTDEVLAFTIDPAFLERLSLEADYPHAIELISTFKHRDSHIEEVAQSIQREIQTADWGNQLYLDSLANLLAIHLLRNYTSQPLTRSKPKAKLRELALNQVLDYIDAHLEQEIQLSDLAQIANFNPCYFTSLFKRSMGISPWQYVMQQRVERAKQLLKHHNHSLSEIAAQCGFNHQSHFTYQFRKLTGVTPKTYRQER
jgi:AraC family transcriptional regulator